MKYVRFLKTVSFTEIVDTYVRMQLTSVVQSVTLPF